MPYSGSKLSRNERKLCQGVGTRQAWTPGVAPVVLQSCLGSAWQQSLGGCRGALPEQCTARQFAQQPGNPGSSSQRSSWHPVTTSFSSSLAKNHSAHNPVANLTALHGSTLESPQHTALFLKDTLRHKEKWMISRNSAGSLRFIQSRKKYNLLLPRPWHLTQKWIIRKKKKSSQTTS